MALKFKIGNRIISETHHFNRQKIINTGDVGEIYHCYHVADSGGRAGYDVSIEGKGHFSYNRTSLENNFVLKVNYRQIWKSLDKNQCSKA